MRSDGYPVVTLHAWVTLKEAKKYDLIDGIWDELKLVDQIVKKS